MDKILEIVDLNGYGFNNFNLLISKNKFISIIGSNMCGKTTLFRIISGIIPTYDVVKYKNIWLNKNNVNKYITKLGVVSVYEDRIFLKDDVYDELSYPLINLGYRKSYIDKRINYVLNIFKLDIENKKISELSLIEKQKLLFCLALLHEPSILLINGVFDYLLTKDVKEIIDILKSINITIINFSVSLDFLSLCDYVYILDKYNIVLENTPENILKEYKKLIKIGLQIPYMFNLSNKFKDLGLINNDYDNIEDMVEELWK